MKLKLILLILMLSHINLLAQTSFEPGYFINNDGTKVTCLIKPFKWGQNPVSFQYRLSEDGRNHIGTIEKIREFGYGGDSKFVRATVNIDQSSNAIANLTYDRNPVFKQETLFLQVLVEGKASLFFSSIETTNRFYFNIDGGKIEQLIFKSYLVTPSKIGKNNRYKQQLATTLLLCDKLTEKDFESLKYKSKPLIKIMKTYNNCYQVDNNDATTAKKKSGSRKNQKNKGKLGLYLRPGITFSQYYTQTKIQREDFEDKTGFRIGLELEYLFPSKKQHWAIFLEPSYRNYESEKTVLYEDFYTIQKYTTITVKKNSFDIVAGPRYYFHISDKSSLFMEIALLVDTNINSEEISSEDIGYFKDWGTELGNCFGLGYRYNNKLSLQFRYNNYGNNFSSTAIILGYNFL